MFCCTICSSMFTGVYPEVIQVTPCGHAFHMKCLHMCLQKSKCPFCTSHIDKNKLIQLHLQVDKNWKDTVTSLTSKANSSVINLDETLNETLRIEDPASLSNKKLVKNNPNESVIEVFDSPICRYKYLPPYIPGSKTLLTTSLSGILLSSKVQDLLSIFNDIIPNSVIKKRLLVTENKLLQTAAEEGFERIIIINMHLGNPIGLCFIMFSEKIKVNVSLKTYKCLEYKSLKYKTKAPPLAIKILGELNELQEFIVCFFSKICNDQFKQINEEKINITCKYSDVEFSYNLAGLYFSVIAPSDFDDYHKINL